MAYHDREYVVYVVLGDPRVEPALWTWPSWRVAVDALAPLIDDARGKPAVRTTQFEGESMTAVRFGRIGWNDAGHAKWVHESPSNAERCKSWQFMDAELWAPSWSDCARDGRSPDVFFAIRNEASRSRGKGALRFNPVLVLAVASDLGSEREEAALRAIRTLSAHLSAVLTVSRRRPWGRASGIGYTNAIRDLVTVGLFRVGHPHARAVDESTFEESWTRVPST